MRNRTYQMVCPNCKHEFAYNNGDIDAEIAKLGVEIATLEQLIQEYKLLPKEEQRKRAAWRKRVGAKAAKKKAEISAAKAFRKSADQQVEKFLYDAFKRRVREEFGDEVFVRLMIKAEEDTKAYALTGMMRHEYYTRSNAKADVTSINKL